MVNSYQFNFSSIKEKLIKGSLKNIFVLMTGSVSSQLLLVLFAPLLSRLYSPEKYGDYAIFVSVISVITVLCSLKFELAIILPKRERDALSIVNISLFILILLTIIITAVVLVFRKDFNGLLKIEKEKMFLLFIPVSFLLIGLFQIGNYWQTRTKDFSNISKSLFMRSSGLLIVQTVLGFMGAGSFGLILGKIFGDFIGTIVITSKSIRKWAKGIIKTKPISLLYNFNKYSDFPKFSAPQSLLNAISQNLPVLMLTTFFGVTVAGLYSMAIRVVLLPLDFISQSVKQVYFEKASRIYNDGGNVYNLFIKSTLGLAAIGILPMAIFFVFGPLIFSLLLGKEWESAGIFARILSFWLFFLFVNPPTTALLFILKKQKHFFIYDICLLFARTTVLLLGGYLKNLNIALILYTTVGVVANCYLICYVWTIVKNYKGKYV